MIAGLKHLFSPDAVKIHGHNAIHVFGFYALSSLFAVSALCPAGFYSLANDVVALGFYFGCVINFLFGSYKIAVLLIHSDDIWKICDGLMPRSDAAVCGRVQPYGRYDENIYRYWNRRTAYVSRTLIAFIVVAALFWLPSPIVFSDSPLTIRDRNGSRRAYRLNIFNVYMGASDVTYNEHFPVFYLLEIVLVLIPYLFSITAFDLVTVFICFSFCCRLEQISEAVSALGHSTSRPEKISNTSNDVDTNDIVNQEEKHDMYDCLKSFIDDHQKVTKLMSGYYAIFYPAIITEIFVASSSHVILWFISASSIVNNGLADSILSFKVVFAIPVFTFHLFVKCYLFGIINELKESIIFALYSCNWIEMNIKNKKMVLFTMKMNNANNLKIQFTSTKIVNLEMFTQTMRLCYSIFSMLINYNQNKEM